MKLIDLPLDRGRLFGTIKVMKSEMGNNFGMEEVVNTYAEIFKLVGIEAQEANELSEKYLATVLRRTGEVLAQGNAEREPKEELQSIDELAEFLDTNFEQLALVEELGKQYILFYGEWSGIVLPLLPEEKRVKVQGMLKDLGDRLANRLKDNE